MKRINYFVAYASFVLVPAVSAQAQTVDYGTLQSLFGEPITTSVTGTPQRASDVPADMTIITADEIRQSGSRSIPEILERVPGLDVMQTGSQSYDVGVRGYNQAFQPRLLVLLNGRQVFLDDYSRTDWNAIPVNIDEIRQIEVVKGPNAALFGNNAVGGVINIITYNPFYDKVDVADVTGGTQRYREADATVGQKLGDWGGLKVSAGALNNDEFDTTRSTTEQEISVNPVRRYASADGVFQLATSIQGELETTYVKSQATGAAFNTGLYTESSEEISSFKGMLADQTDYGTFKFTSYWNHLLQGISLPAPPSSDLVNDLYVAQLEDQFKAGADHTFRLAAEYRNSQFSLSADEAVPEHPNIEYQTISESGMWSWQVLKNLNFTNALRLDEHQENLMGTLWPGSSYSAIEYDNYTTQLNANSGLVWQASDQDTFRLTYGRGVQYPSYDYSGVNLNASLGGPAIIAVEGNPQLTPTITTNYELDYDRKIVPLFSTLRSAVFYTENRSIKTDINGPSSFPVAVYITTANVGASNAAGAEWELSGNHDHFRWDGSYSLANVTEDPGVKTNLHYQDSAPQNSVKLNLGYTWNQWEFDGFGYYVSAREQLISPYGSAVPIQLVTTNGYASLSGRIGYNINEHVTVAVSGTCLNQSSLDETAYPGIERQVFLSLTGKL